MRKVRYLDKVMIYQPNELIVSDNALQEATEKLKQNPLDKELQEEYKRRLYDVEEWQKIHHQQSINLELVEFLSAGTINDREYWVA